MNFGSRVIHTLGLAATRMTGSSSNPYQYTGREDDGTGLYYYRSRYYSPVYQRFISEDPFRFGGGVNFYAHVGNGPTYRVDPFGRNWRRAANFFAGAGSVLSFGLTDAINAATGADKVINTSSGWYTAGQTTGGLLLAAIAAEAAEAAGADTVTVVHYTDEAGMTGINASGQLNAGSFVTLPSEIPEGATQAEIEELLEVSPGRGAYSITFETPASNLSIPPNGATTSEGALQYIL